MKSIKIKIESGEIEISKLPLGRYAELLKAIKQIPQSVKGFAGKSNDEIFAQLPTIIGESLPDLIGILVIATPLTKEQIEEMGLDEATKVIMAVIEVNNYRDVFDTIKKALARPAQVAK